MFSAFSANYTPDSLGHRTAEDLDLPPELEATQGGRDFFKNYSGASFNRGIYRVHSADSIKKWNSIVAEAFPGYSKRIVTFGTDWLGRHFALDRGRVVNGELQVLLLEPGTGESLEVPANFLDFHERELTLQSEAALAAEFFMNWLAAGNRSPERNQCVGYKKPLFLGGKDTIENLELTDMEVYWSICGQLLAKVRNLPPGTRVGQVSIS